MKQSTQKNSPVQLRRKLINLRYRMRLTGYDFYDKERICILPGGCQ